MPNLSEQQVEFMRQDIKCNFALSKIIDLAKARFKEQGKDFDKEFKEWKDKKNEK
jgi:hypothetical protein